MWDFLYAAAKDTILQYPLFVTHRTDLVPDFSIKSGARTIGVECSIITDQNLEMFRKLPDAKDWCSISAFTVPAKKMKPEELKVAASPLNAEWVDYDQSMVYLLHRTEDRLKEKSAKLSQSQYREHDQQWLLLWDRLSLSPSDSLRNSTTVQRYWNQAWRRCCPFDRVIIGCGELNKFAVLTPDEMRIVETPKKPVPRRLKKLVKKFFDSLD